MSQRIYSLPISSIKKYPRRCFSFSKPRPRLYMSVMSSLKAKHPIDYYSNKTIHKGTSKLDPITLHRIKAMQEAYYKRRMVYLTIGVLFGMAGLYLTAIQAPLPPSTPLATSLLSSSYMHGLDSRKFADNLRVNFGWERELITSNLEDHLVEQIDPVTTGNSIIPHFPRFLAVNDTSNSNIDSTEYQLLGLGTRTVSFLKIQVYVVGIYVASDDITTLQSKLIKRVNPKANTLVADEKNKLFNMLVDPVISEQIWDSILRDSSCGMLIRIVPTRNTDFGHLRDAWVRAMISRAQRVGWKDERFGNSVRDFRKIFTRGSIPKGAEILLCRGKRGNLHIWCDGGNGRDNIGEVLDERVSRAVWLGYLAGKDVACESAREGVVASLLKIVERPIGSTIVKL